MIRCAAAVVIATPAPSSIAPVPRSQLSRWPPITIMPARGIGARHFGDDVAGLAACRCRAASASDASSPACRAARMRWSCSASGTDSAAAGIGRDAVAEGLDAGMRIAVMIGADRADRRSRPRPCGWRCVGPGGAARRTGRSPSRPGSASCGGRRRRSGRAPLRRAPPRARRRCRSRPPRPRSPAAASRPNCRARSGRRRCGKGETISACSAPRTQTGMSNGSTWTLLKPSALSRRTAQSRARASASVPARRWPTSVVRPSRKSQATVSALSAASRSVGGRTAGRSVVRREREARARASGEQRSGFFMRARLSRLRGGLPIRCARH